LLYFNELNAEQRRIFVDVEQAYSVYRDALEEERRYRGTVEWRERSGKDYLYRRTSSRVARSLGPRSPETENTYRQFNEHKAAAKERLKSLSAELERRGRFARTAGLARVPVVITKLSELLENEPALQNRVSLVGTNALYAYEARAGIRIVSEILATQDADVLWDSRQQMAIAGNLTRGGFIGLLRRVDPTFKRVERQAFRAANSRSYLVDLITAQHDIRDDPEKVRMAQTLPDELVATEMKELQWLISAPKMRQLVIGEDGRPVMMTVPDPRAFALHKEWLSRQLHRDPLKRPRDKEQAIAVAQLVADYLPDLPMSADMLRMFPAEIRGDSELM